MVENERVGYNCSKMMNESQINEIIYLSEELVKSRTHIRDIYEKNFSVRMHNHRSAQENIEAVKEELAEKEQLRFLQQLPPPVAPQMVQQRPTSASA